MLNRLTVIGCLLGIALSAADARAQDVLWAQRMGGISDDYGRGIAVDGGGNAHVTASFKGTADFGSYSLTSAGGFEVVVTKVDGSGTVRWARRMGSQYDDSAGSIAVDGNGNTYVTGAFWGTADFGSYNLTSTGNHDIFVTKLDRNGVVQWAQRLGGVYIDYGFGIAVDGSGNAYVTGSFSETADFGSYSLTSAGGAEIFVTKLGGNGIVQWAKRMGSMNHDEGHSISVDGSGNPYLTGYFAGTADFGPFNLTSADHNDAFVAKLDSSGTVQWAQRMGGTQGDGGHSISVDGSGNPYVTGSFQGTADFGPFSLTSAGSYDTFAAKLDGSGTVQWAQRMGGTQAALGFGISVDGSGNSYLMGYFSGTAEFGSRSLTSAGSRDIFVTKLDGSGTVQWAQRMGGISADSGRGIAVDGGGEAYVTGSFEGMADFGSYSLTSAGDSDVFVAKLSSCYFFDGQGAYGRLLFPPLCTRDAMDLTEDVYDSMTVGIDKYTNDTFYLSSDGMSFAPLVVDDSAHVNSQGSGLGPYDFQAGVPPVVIDVPIEYNWVPLPAHDITSLIPDGGSPVLFELLDTQREIYGNTAVYLVRDCGIYVENAENTVLHWLSHDVEIEGFTSNLDVVTGLLAELLADGDFTRAKCLGSFMNTTQAADTQPVPLPGVGYYYLVSGTCAQPIGYGDSSLMPDPRDDLVAICP